MPEHELDAENDVLPLKKPVSNHDGMVDGPKPFHRIREVRLRQEVSLRTAARQMKLDIGSVRDQEEETADLKLSDLYRWQQVLEVPVAELLSDDDDSLSATILHRARMVKVMKTAQAILERAPNAPTQRLGQMLVEQLTEVMPELAEVSAWHQSGQRRTQEDVGRAAREMVSLKEVRASAV